VYELIIKPPLKTQKCYTSLDNVKGFLLVVSNGKYQWKQLAVLMNTE
jgi:hypothetical protein